MELASLQIKRYSTQTMWPSSNTNESNEYKRKENFIPSIVFNFDFCSNIDTFCIAHKWFYCDFVAF